MMGFLIAAITLGFLGSFHCVGMCGPIALALPVHHEPAGKKIFLVLAYNLGRMLTYAGFGLAAGLAGEIIFLAGFQRSLSIVIGGIIIAAVLVPSMVKKIFPFETKIFALFNNVKTHLSGLLLKKGARSLFIVGLLNGLLPCGLVYMGIGSAVVTGDVFKGALFMAVFGLGTIPAMLTLQLAGSYFTVNVRNTIRRSVPVIITVMGILLILRGLNLGIPYLSPGINAGESTCHTMFTPDHSNDILCTGPNSQHKK